MLHRIVLLSLAAALLPHPALAQTPPPAPAATPRGGEIVVTGEREAEAPSVVTRLRDMIKESGSSQLARFEATICPMVIGLPRDLTARMIRMVRDNIAATGGVVGKPGCKVNGAVIFIDQPLQLVTGLRKVDPTFFMNMPPREFAYFTERRRPVYSWHTVNKYSKDGALVTGPRVRSDGSRLYTSVRDEMESGIVVIDRQATIGKNLRQLADFATMHLMLDVNWRARRIDPESILALFQNRVPNPAPRMSSFDRNALRGFYLLRENNQTAANQRQNIARAIKRQEEGKQVVGKRPDR